MSDKQRGDNYGQSRAAATSATVSCSLPSTRLADYSQSGNLSQVGHGQSANPHPTSYGVQKHNSSIHSVQQKGQSSVPRHSNEPSELEMVFQKRLKPKKKFPRETPNSSSSNVSKSPPPLVHSAKSDSSTFSASIQSPSQLQPQPPPQPQPQHHSHFSVSSPIPPPRSTSLQNSQNTPTTNGQVQNVGMPGYCKITPRRVYTPNSFNQDFSDFTDSEDCRTPDISVFNMSEGYRTPLESEDEAETASKHSYAASSTRFPFKSEIVKHFEKPVPVFLKCQSWCNQIPDSAVRKKVVDPNLSKELQNIESFESAMLDWFQTLSHTKDDDDLRSEASVSSMGSYKSEYRLRSLVNNRFQNSEQIENVLTGLLAISDQYAQVTDTESVVSESQKSEKPANYQTLNLEKKSFPRRGRATVIRRNSGSDMSGSESESEQPRKPGNYKTVLSELQAVLRQRGPVPEPPDSEESGLGSSEYSNPPTSPLSPNSAPPTMPKPQFPKVHQPRVAKTAQVTRKPLVNAGDFKLLLGELSTAWSKRLRRIRKAQLVSQRGMQSSLYANFQGFRIPEVLIEEKSTKYANFEGKLEPAAVINPEPEATVSCQLDPKAGSVSKPMVYKNQEQGTKRLLLPSEIAKKEQASKSPTPTETQSATLKEMTGQELLESVHQPGLKRTGFKMHKYIKNVASGGALPEITEENYIPSPSHRKLAAILKEAETAPPSIPTEAKKPTSQSIESQTPSPTPSQVKSLPQISQDKSPPPPQLAPSHIQSSTTAQINAPSPAEGMSPASPLPLLTHAHHPSAFHPPLPQVKSPTQSSQVSSPQVWSPSSVPQAQVWSPPSSAQVCSPPPHAQVTSPPPPPYPPPPAPPQSSKVPLPDTSDITITQVKIKTAETPVDHLSMSSIPSSEMFTLTSKILVKSEPVVSRPARTRSVTPTTPAVISDPVADEEKKIILDRLNKIGERNVIVKEELPELPMDLVRASAIKIQPLLTEKLDKLVHVVKEESTEQSPISDEPQNNKKFEVILDNTLPEESPAEENKVEASVDVQIPLVPSEPEVSETHILSEESQNKQDVNLGTSESSVPETGAPATDLQAEITCDINLENIVVSQENQSLANENKSEDLTSISLDTVMETVLLNIETMDNLLSVGETKAEKTAVVSKEPQEKDIVFPVSLSEETASFKVQDNINPTVSVSINDDSIKSYDITIQKTASLEKIDSQEIDELLAPKDSPESEACVVSSPVFSQAEDAIPSVLVSTDGEDLTKDYKVSVGENEIYNGDDISFSVVLEDSMDTNTLTPTDEELENLWVNSSAVTVESQPEESAIISDKSLEPHIVEALTEVEPTLEEVREIEPTSNPELTIDYLTMPDNSSEPLPFTLGDVSTVGLQTAEEAPPFEEVSKYEVLLENLPDGVTVPVNATEFTEVAPFISVLSPLEPEMPVFENPPEAFNIPVQDMMPTVIDAGEFVKITEKAETLLAPEDSQTEVEEISYDQLKQSIKEEMLKSEDITKVLVLESLKSSGPNGSPDDHEYVDAIGYSSDDSLIFEDTLSSPLMQRRVYTEVVRAEIGSRVETLQSWGNPEPLRSWPNQENLQLCSEEEDASQAEDLSLEEFHEAEEVNKESNVPFNSDQQQLVYTLPTIYEATEESLEEERRILHEIDNVNKLIGECVETLEMSPVELAQVQEQDIILQSTGIPGFISEVKCEREVEIDSVLSSLANLKNGSAIPVSSSSNGTDTLFGELKRSQGLTALDQICGDQSPESKVLDGSPQEKVSDHVSPETFSDDEMLHPIPYNVAIEKPELFEEEILPAMSRKTIFDKMGVGKIMEEEKSEETEDEVSPSQTRSEKMSEDEEESDKSWIIEANTTDVHLPEVMSVQQPLVDKFENLIEYLESDAAKELQEFERIESACERLSKDHRKDSVVSDFSVGNLEKPDDFETLIKSLDSELEEDVAQNVLTNPKEDLVPGVVMVPVVEEDQKMETSDYKSDSEDRLNQTKVDDAFTSKEDFFDAYSEVEYTEYMLSRDPEDSGYIDAVPIIESAEIKDTAQNISSQANEEVDTHNLNDSDYHNYMLDRENETHKLMTLKTPVMSRKATDIDIPVNGKSSPSLELVITSPELQEQEPGIISEEISLIPNSSIETEETPLVIRDEIDEEYFTIKCAEHTVEKAFEYLLSSKTALLKDDNETSPEPKTDPSLSSVEYSGSTSEDALSPTKEIVLLPAGDIPEGEGTKLSKSAKKHIRKNKKTKALQSDDVSVTETESKISNEQDAIIAFCTSVEQNIVSESLTGTEMVDTENSSLPSTDSSSSNITESKNDSKLNGKPLVTTSKITPKVRSTSSSSSSTECSITSEQRSVPPGSLPLSEEAKDTATGKKKRKKKKKKGKDKDEPMSPSMDIAEPFQDSEKLHSESTEGDMKTDTKSDIVIEKSEKEALEKEAVNETQSDLKSLASDSGSIDPSVEFPISDQTLESHKEIDDNLLMSTNEASVEVSPGFISETSVTKPSLQETPAISSELADISSSLISSEFTVKSEKQEIGAGEILEESVLSTSESLETTGVLEIQSTTSPTPEKALSSAVSSDQLESTSAAKPPLQETPAISSELADISSTLISSEFTVKSEKQEIEAGEILAESLLSPTSELLETIRVLELQSTVSAASETILSSGVSTDQLESPSELITNEMKDSQLSLEEVAVSENTKDITFDTLTKDSAPLSTLESEQATPTDAQPESSTELASVTSLKQPAPVAPSTPSSPKQLVLVAPSSTPEQQAPIVSSPSLSPKQPAPIAPSASSPKQPAPIASSPSSSPKQPAPIAPSSSPKQPASVSSSPSSSPKQPAPIAPSSSPKQPTSAASSSSSSPKQPALISPSSSPKQPAPIAPSPSSSLKQPAPIAPTQSSSPSSSLKQSALLSSSSSAINKSPPKTPTSVAVLLESNRDSTVISVASNAPIKFESGPLSDSYQRKAAFLASLPKPSEGSFLHRGSSLSALSELKYMQPPPRPRSLRDMEPPQPPTREHSKDNIPSDSLKSESIIGAPLCAPEDSKIPSPTLGRSRNVTDESLTLTKSSQSLTRTNSPTKRFRDLKHFSRISNMTYNEVIEMEEEEHRIRYDFGTNRRIREMRYFGRICRGDSEDSIMSRKSGSSDSGILTGYRDLNNSRMMTTSSTSLQVPAASAAHEHRPIGLSDSAVSIDNPREFEPIMSYVSYSQSGDPSAAEMQRYASSGSCRSNTLQPSDRHRQDVSGYGRIQKTHDMAHSTHSLDYHAGHSKFVHPGVNMGDQEAISHSFQDSGLCASNFSVGGQESDDNRSMVSSLSFVIPEARPMENIVMDDDSESIYEDVAMYPTPETMSLRSDIGSVKSLNKLKKFGSKLKKFSKIKFKKFWK